MTIKQHCQWLRDLCRQYGPHARWVDVVGKTMTGHETVLRLAPRIAIPAGIRR
jgi:hypothetical protein